MAGGILPASIFIRFLAIDSNAVKTGMHPSPMDSRRARREVATIAVVLVAALLAGVAGLWLTSTAAIRDTYNLYLIGIARTATQMIDPALHDSLRDASQRNGAAYQRAVEPLRRLRAAAPDVKYIYTMVRVGDEYHFVLDAADPGDNDGDGVDDQAEVWEVYEDLDPVMQIAFGSDGQPGRVATTDQPYPDKWGTFMTAWAPLIDKEGRQFGALGVDVSADAYVARLAAARRSALIGLLPAGLLILALSLIFYRTRVRGLEQARLLAAEQHRVQDSETSLRSLFELSPVGICLVDMNSGRFLRVNDALVTSTGFSREALLDMTFHELTPADWHEFESRQLAVLDERDNFGPYEKEYQRKDGSRYPVLISGLRTRDATSRHVAWAIVQDISTRKAMELALADAARRDKLTGLANRALFLERLQAAIDRVREGQQKRFAVLFLDFDRFKLVNDAMGHQAGDALLCEIADRLRESLDEITDSRRDSHMIARFGGDEFLILLNDPDESPGTAQVVERLLESLARVYNVQGREVYSTASIGIVTSEQGLEDADAVVRNADVAMYEAKRTGRARAIVFDESMRLKLTRHVMVENCLRKSLGTPEISLVFQPIMELSEGRIASVEALTRWEHPVMGQVSPSEFIPVAEESGLIVELGQWVLHEACHTLAAWRREHGDAAPGSISVNISRAELAQGERLLERVRAVLASSGLPPQALLLEVTEREVMRDPAATRKLMQALRNLGVRLAMDDFGTGTSSLDCLRDYPFDVIKVDRSFIRDVACNADMLAVIHATITLVENLGRTSVAEGVENGEQVAVLQALGCHYAQGFHFHRPMPAKQLSALLAQAPAGQNLIVPSSAMPRAGSVKP